MTDRDPPAPGIGGRTFEGLELAALYGLLPGLLVLGVVPIQARWLIFLGTAVYLAAVLFRVRPSPRTLGLVPVRPATLGILAVLVLGALGTIALLSATGRIPRARAVQWIFVFVLYPGLSVPAQELFFRGFFFTRYGHLFSKRGGALVNAALFAFYHAIFGSLPAVAAALAAGVLLAIVFIRRRDLYLCWLLHYAFGCAVFFSGWAHGFTALSGF